MPKVIIYEGEPYDYFIDQGEMFGKLALEEQGVEISQELFLRISSAIEEKNQVNKILQKLREESYEKDKYDNEAVKRRRKVLEEQYFFVDLEGLT